MYHYLDFIPVLGYLLALFDDHTDRKMRWLLVYHAVVVLGYYWGLIAIVF